MDADNEHEAAQRAVLKFQENEDRAVSHLFEEMVDDVTNQAQIAEGAAVPGEASSLPPVAKDGWR